MLSWRKLRKLAACAAMVALAAPLACSVDPVTFTAGPPPEDCAAPGDEDGDGAADCADAACAAEPACIGVCLDGVVDPLEACDDGNTVDGDGCDGNCTPTGCGNGVATAGELCDDGNADNTDACVAGCVVALCGDGFVRATVEACDDGGLVASDGCEPNCRLSPIAYLKASNTGSSDLFGWSVALSADGSTLAVGALYEASAASGIDGDQTSNAAPSAGAVYVFVRVGGAWKQQAYLKASNTGTGDQFGWSVALSQDGSTLAVGAFTEDSAATGAGGDQASDAAIDSGAVYVFTRSGTAWSQQAYLKASNTGVSDYFGWSVALSSDGSTLAVGAPLEDSAASGVGGDQANNSLQDAGAAYVFTRAGAVWSQQAYVKAPLSLSGNQVGYHVALSGDGATLATGAQRESAVYVYTRTGAIWSPQSTVRATLGGPDYLGFRVALSEDGSTLAASALYEDSAATGVGGDPENNAAADSGAAYVFTRTGGVWAQQAYIKATNTDAADYFGYSLALSRDGSSLAVGAYGEDSPATGVGGDQTLNSAPYAGAVYRYARSGATWSPQAYVKASNTEANDYFGISVALSGDGALLAAGAYIEDGGTTGAGGNPANNNAPSSGAAYVYQ